MTKVDIGCGGIEPRFYDKGSALFNGALELLTELVELDDLDGAAPDQVQLFVQILFHEDILQAHRDDVNNLRMPPVSNLVILTRLDF